MKKSHRCHFILKNNTKYVDLTDSTPTESQKSKKKWFFTVGPDLLEKFSCWGSGGGSNNEKKNTKPLKIEDAPCRFRKMWLKVDNWSDRDPQTFRPNLFALFVVADHVVAYKQIPSKQTKQQLYENMNSTPDICRKQTSVRKVCANYS